MSQSCYLITFTLLALVNLDTQGGILKTRRMCAGVRFLDRALELSWIRSGW